MTSVQHVLPHVLPRIAARRASPRLRVEDAVHVHVATPSSIAVIRCRDLSFDGLLLETSTPVVPGTRAQLGFETDDGFAVTLSAVAIHARPAEGERQIYLSGWEFLHDQPTATAVHVLIHAVLMAGTRDRYDRYEGYEGDQEPANARPLLSKKR